MANKSGSDGQIRKTTAEWAVDTDTYLEGMRLMDTTTGTVRVSKGTTYALAWVPASGGGATAWGDITGTLSDQTDLQNVTEGLANAIGAIVTQTITSGETTTSPSEDAVFAALAGKADALVVNATRQATAVPIIITGTTDGSGRLTVDFSAASTDRPALSAFHFVAGSGVAGVNQLTAYIQVDTLATYAVQFWNLASAGEDSGGTSVSFFGWGIPV